MNKAQQISGRTQTAPAQINEKTKRDAEAPPAFPDEIAHLADISAKIEDALQQAIDSVEGYDKEYRDSKRYMVQHKGEIDPHEMFQNELALRQIDHQGVIAVETRDKLAKLKESPYFARIDFREEAKKEPAIFYVGRFAFSHDSELLISDWRSPVASMFYDCEVGPAGYDAPIGRINGDLTRKRQFKIKNGEMEYTLESSVNIQDDILQRELSHTSEEKMKSIITTIQKEQNQIIRNEKAGTLIIQGVAGSGKTSIALHRIAYLLYRFKDRLAAKNVTILSPNKVFGDYISSVLPELGEEPIYGMSFADIAEVQLEGIIDFEPDKDPLETNDSKWAKRVRLKSTLDFVELVDKYLEEMSNSIFEPRDYTFGRFTAKCEWTKQRFDAYSKHPVKRRLQMIADDIFDRFETENYREDTLPRVKVIFKSLTSMLKVKNTLELYKDFYKQMNMPDMFVMPAKKTLEWADVFPFMYFQAAFEGLQESQVIRHLVIDEMQDYTPIQYAVMNILFKCQKTILGDFGQFINPNHLHNFEDLRALYGGAEVVELNKSYRSTYEIITFAKRIRNVAALEAVERHGDEPALIQCRNKEEELARIKEMIEAFEEGDKVTLGIIVKTNSEAKALYDRLSQDYEVQLISLESSAFINGISITSIQMSKGLEFDEVIIPAANSKTYTSDYDRSLLYIACTRAMHRLALTCSGELTRLIDGDTEEVRRGA
ncbi:HelD family protein [Desulfosporosinus nitroreducens]|uniref:HelD family protein n=1 Tax=Desulfosporosinus nitroreducens TaxID=2018668 RepID=UPI00207D41FC|nr:3'-5' exonuclease [Desulfosporosinus nitroreducens]MCO1603779.1 AAA family ATPase [Desulfosporosinus nitroreducens]